LSVGLSVGLLVRGMAVTRELEVESHREATESAVEGQLLRGIGDRRERKCPFFTLTVTAFPRT
jgi:hypothetical protein